MKKEKTNFWTENIYFIGIRYFLYFDVNCYVQNFLQKLRIHSKIMNQLEIYWFDGINYYLSLSFGNVAWVNREPTLRFGWENQEALRIQDHFPYSVENQAF